MTDDKQIGKKLNISGLDTVSLGETLLSHVDGERGELVVGGYSIDDLAENCRFEDVCHLLWVGSLPSAQERKALKDSLGQQRVDVFHGMKSLTGGAKNGMDFIRRAVAAVAPPDDQEECSRERVTAAVAVAAAIWNRVNQGLPPIPPRAEACHGEDYLHMITGRDVDERLWAALDRYWVTVIDHGMNASTFAARVVASTGSDLVSSVVAGIGALKGPLHGGAPGPVLDMLNAIATPENALIWLEKELSLGRRIMGMGHRIYRVRDPRAAVLEAAILKLEKSGLKSRTLTLARSVERAAADLLAQRYPGRPLKANVEFYTAVLLDVIGLPPGTFATTFAAGRVAGWCAHVKEQREFGRLIRPQSTYSGPMGLKVLGLG